MFPNIISNVNLACSVENCASCDDDSTCKECNAPYALVENNKCELCEEGTYFDKGSCKSIYLLKWKWIITDKECDDENCALCKDNGATCKICSNGFILNDLDECKPTICSIENCASCDDSSTCNECNAPFALNEDNECQLCEEGTYFNENGSCESIYFLNYND